MTPYQLSGAGFFLLTLLSFYILVRIIFRAIDSTPWDGPQKKRARIQLVIVFVGWGLFVSAASLSGFSSRFELFPANAGPFLILPLVSILWITFSKRSKPVLEAIAPSGLLYLQFFRVGVEILLWSLFVQQLLPVQMTFEGRNFDILSGALGPITAFFFRSNRTVQIAYHIIGLALLINIVGTALLSMPTPYRIFMEEPANTIVMRFPFILLPTFLVPLAYGLHFLALRQLALKK